MLFLVGEFSGSVYLKNRIQVCELQVMACSCLSTMPIGTIWSVDSICNPPSWFRNFKIERCGRLWANQKTYSFQHNCATVLSDEGRYWLLGTTIFYLLNVFVTQVRLPAEPEDWVNRPSYITAGKFGGVSICNNRRVFEMNSRTARLHLLTRFPDFNTSSPKGLLCAKGDPRFDHWIEWYKFWLQSPSATQLSPNIGAQSWFSSLRAPFVFILVFHRADQ